MKVMKCGKICSYAEGEREYYLVGGGAGDLRDSGWDILNVKGCLVMKAEEVEDATVHRLTLRLYAGDRFLLCHDGDWEGQVGIGCMEGVTYDATPAKIATVTDDDGRPVFCGRAAFGHAPAAWDIRLCEGMDGVYTLTYTAPEGEEQGVLRYERVEALPPLDPAWDLCLVGDYNGWDTQNAPLRLCPAEKGDSYTLLWYTQEGGEFKLYDRVRNAWYGPGGGNLRIPFAGCYGVRFTPETEEVTLERCRLHVEGRAPAGETMSFFFREGEQVHLTVAGRTLAMSPLTDPSAGGREPHLRVLYRCSFGSLGVESEPI